MNYMMLFFFKVFHGEQQKATKRNRNGEGDIFQTKMVVIMYMYNFV